VTPDSCRDKKKQETPKLQRNQNLWHLPQAARKIGSLQGLNEIETCRVGRGERENDNSRDKGFGEIDRRQIGLPQAEMTKNSNVEPEVSATSVTSDKTKKSNISKAVKSTTSNTMSGPSDPVASEQEPPVSKQPSMSEQLITPTTDKSKQQQNASEISKILSDLILTAATIELKNEVTLHARHFQVVKRNDRHNYL
jgi:hypothetical protein